MVLTIRRTCSGVGGGLEDDAPCLGGVDGLFPEDIKRWAAKDAGLQNIYDRRFSNAMQSRHRVEALELNDEQELCRYRSPVRTPHRAATKPTR